MKNFFFLLVHILSFVVNDICFSVSVFCTTPGTKKNKKKKTGGNRVIIASTPARREKKKRT